RNATMSSVSLRLACVLVLSGVMVVSGTMSAAPPAKQKKDDLDRIGAIATVAGQKAEADVRYAINASMTSKSREKAVQFLTAAKDKVENNQALPDARRASLVKMLNARIKAFEAEPDPKAMNQGEIDKA